MLRFKGEISRERSVLLAAVGAQRNPRHNSLLVGLDFTLEQRRDDRQDQFERR
jgi:hypothetical protein